MEEFSAEIAAAVKACIAALCLATLFAGCESPDAVYRKIGDSQIGTIDRVGIMRKYGPPQRTDKIGDSEFWTYTLDLGTSTQSVGNSFATGSAVSSYPITTGSASGFSSMSQTTTSMQDDFTYEFDKNGVVRGYRFNVRRGLYNASYSSP